MPVGPLLQLSGDPGRGPTPGTTEGGRAKSRFRSSMYMSISWSSLASMSSTCQCVLPIVKQFLIVKSQSDVVVLYPVTYQSQNNKYFKGYNSNVHYPQCCSLKGPELYPFSHCPKGLVLLHLQSKRLKIILQDFLLVKNSNQRDLSTKITVTLQYYYEQGKIIFRQLYCNLRRERFCPHLPLYFYYPGSQAYLGLVYVFRLGSLLSQDLVQPVRCK